jgi:hypothetical protein
VNGDGVGVGELVELAEVVMPTKTQIDRILS